MSEDSNDNSFQCQQCGRCCKKVGYLFENEATIKDLARWIGNKRYDILEWVDPVTHPLIEGVDFDYWIGPRTHDDVNRCPWLRKKHGTNIYECEIYDLRPNACREWPRDMEEAQKLGCPACENKAGEVIEFPRKKPG